MRKRKACNGAGVLFKDAHLPGSTVRMNEAPCYSCNGSGIDMLEDENEIVEDCINELDGFQITVTEEAKRLFKLNPGPKLKLSDLDELSAQEKEEVKYYYRGLYGDYRRGRFDSEALGDFLGLGEEGTKQLPIITRSLKIHGITPEYHEIDRIKYKIYLWRRRFYKTKGLYVIQPVKSEFAELEKLKEKLKELRIIKNEKPAI